MIPLNVADEELLEILEKFEEWKITLEPDISGSKVKVAKLGSFLTACEKGRKRLVQALLLGMRGVKLKESFLDICLTMAVSKNHGALVEFLLEAKSSPSSIPEIRKMMLTTVLFGNDAMYRTISDHYKANYNLKEPDSKLFPGNEHLIKAVSKNHTNLVHGILHDGTVSDPSIPDETPLKTAIQLKSGDIVGLLANSIDVNINLLFVGNGTYTLLPDTQIANIISNHPKFTLDSDQLPIKFVDTNNFLALEQLLLKLVSNRSDDNDDEKRSCSYGFDDAVILAVRDPSKNRFLRLFLDLRQRFPHSISYNDILVLREAVQVRNLEAVTMITNDHFRTDMDKLYQEAVLEICRLGDLNMLRSVVISENENRPDFNDSLPFRIAVNYSHHDIVRYLLADKRSNATANDNEAFKRAVELCDTEMIHILLSDPFIDPSIDPSMDHNFALRKSVEIGCLEAVKILLQNDRVHPSDLDNAALRMALNSTNGNGLIIAKLLMNHTRFDMNAGTLPNFLIKSHTEVEQEFLQSSCNVDSNLIVGLSFSCTLFIGLFTYFLVCMYKSSKAKKASNGRIINSLKMILNLEMQKSPITMEDELRFAMTK